jgi:3-oxoadipate enol-lactonase
MEWPQLTSRKLVRFCDKQAVSPLLNGELAPNGHKRARMTQVFPTFHLNYGPIDRPILIFLPGALIPPDAITPVAKLLKIRAIGVGWLEGQGPHDLQSVAARVASMLSDLGPAILIGHSVGTPIAALATAIDVRSAKSNVVGLVLSNSGANTKGHADVDSVIERVMKSWGPPLWAAMAERSIGSVCPPELASSLMSYPRRITAKATAESLRSLQETDLTSMLGELSSVPTVIVHGRRDPARNLSHAESLHNGIVGSRLVVLETGHTSCVEAPADFAQAVRYVVDPGPNLRQSVDAD